ncbi:hypothetical protein Pla123a_07680 [Posidoniimonas polymericola]|uniref:Uncharacterized protein n=1 Tax=Posidoniimonas polymericola TaxID=2528002 RepID=A0A5C5ZFS3_9BACT|nr:hypothetical protein [Posidoniimonas polymericola]TWT85960.1 hypothetical protein Pla123a_07680 [Posidoniimonas polymericola]
MSPNKVVSAYTAFSGGACNSLEIGLRYPVFEIASNWSLVLSEHLDVKKGVVTDCDLVWEQLDSLIVEDKIAKSAIEVAP